MTEIISISFDLLHGGYDSLIALCILLYEITEFSIEGLFIHVFHLKHHNAEIATYYVLISIAILLGTLLWMTAPNLYLKFSRNLKALLLKKRRQTIHLWRSMSLIKKIQWFAITLAGASSMILFA
jgi:hypothetical protein